MKELEEVKKELEKKTKAELIEDGIVFRKLFEKATEEVAKLSEKIKELEKEREENIRVLRETISNIGTLPGILEEGTEEIAPEETEEQEKQIRIVEAVAHLLNSLGYKASDLSLEKK